jgi:hypothetical protein
MTTPTATLPTLFDGLQANAEHRWGDAAQILRGYLALQPDHALARMELGEALMRLGNEEVTEGRYPEAETMFEQAAALGNVGAVFGRSHCRLMRGDTDGYLADYERRWEVPEYRALYWRPFMSTMPLWDGESVDTLLVHGEQGIGDIIQSMRYWDFNARRVIVELRQELVGLARTCFPYRVIVRGDPTPEADAHIPTGSLPSPSNYEFTSPYLRVVDDTPPKTRQRIALCWAGSKLNPRDADRSIPMRLMLDLVNSVEDREWVSVQQGADAETLARNFIHDPCRGLDLLSVAKVLKSCDLVIAPDTAIAHLAGALGVPCWLLLSSIPDPRWRREGNKTDLYSSLTLYRQTTRGDWGEVLQQVQHELEITHGS